jgi:hypothetical protein
MSALEIAPTPLQDAVLGLLEDENIPTKTCDAIIKLIADAEEARAEAAWERHCESLMQGGGGPSLREQQIAAQKFK